MTGHNEDSRIVFDSFTENKWIEWLQLGFAYENFPNFFLADEPSTSRQVTKLYNSLNPRSQQYFKNALIRLIAEWDVSSQPPELLIELCFLAADIRATGSINNLRNIIESGQLHALPEEISCRTMQVIFGVIAGFAPLESVKETLERFFWSNSFDSRFSAQLFLGLCECSPEKYISYFKRFLLHLDQNPDYFSLDYVMAEFARIVSLRYIAQTATVLEASLLSRLLNLLCGYSWSPAILVDDSYFGFFLTPKYTQDEDNDLFSLQTLENGHHNNYQQYKDLNLIVLTSKIEQFKREGSLVNYLNKNIHSYTQNPVAMSSSG